MVYFICFNKVCAHVEITKQNYKVYYIGKVTLIIFTYINGKPHNYDRGIDIHKQDKERYE